MPKPGRVLLIDDNDDLLDGLSDWLGEQAHLEVVGRAHSCLEAIERIERLQPDLVLVDVSLQDASGFELARAIKSRPTSPIVVLLSFHDGAAVRAEALAAGADDVIFETEVTERLIPVIDSLLGLWEGPAAGVAGRPKAESTTRHHGGSK